MIRKTLPSSFYRAGRRVSFAALSVALLAMSACGGGGGGSGDGVSGGTGSPPSPEPTNDKVSVYVSGVGLASAQSTELATRSFNALHLAANPAGDLFISDAANHVVLKADPSGVVTTLAGAPRQFGHVDGNGVTTRLNGPEGIAVDGGGNLMVADKYNHVIRRITPDGAVTTIAGMPGAPGETNGPAATASFRHPQDVAVGPDGTIYVAEPSFGQIRSISADGAVATFAPRVLSGAGHFEVRRSLVLPDEPPTSNAAPTAIAVSASGAVLATEAGDLTLRSLAASGEATYFAGERYQDGDDDAVASPLVARFGRPRGLVVDAAGNTYVADQRNCTIRRIAASGRVDTILGRSGDCTLVEGSFTSARLGPVTDLAISGTTLFAAIPDTGVIVRILDIDQAAQVPGAAEGSPAAATAHLQLESRMAGLATFSAGSTGFTIDPLHTAADAAGNLFIADGNNHIILRLATDGTLTTVAGESGQSGDVDGAPSAARFKGPEGIALGADGSIYVADKLNHRIRRIATDGTVSTLAGGGSERDGPAASASFQFPQDVAVDGQGNVIVAEAGTGTLRRIGTDAMVTTLAGTKNLCGAVDGTGAAASFACGNPLGINFPPETINGPAAVAADADGTLYVADAGIHTVRKITADGQVSTLAGRAGIAGGADGTGSDARFRLPRGIAIDSRGDLYVADEGNCKIGKITRSGTVTTLVGMRESCDLNVGPLATARIGARVNNLSYANGTLSIAQNNRDTTGGTGLMLSSTLLTIRGLE